MSRSGTPSPLSASATLGRVLIVGDPSLAQTVRDVLFEAELEASVDVVADYLMALGDARFNPPRVILGRVRGLEEMLEATVSGLRRLAPEARLVLIVRPHEEPEALRAVEAGFDDYLIEPTDPDELLVALTGERQEAPLKPKRTPPSSSPVAAVEPPVVPLTDPVAPAPKLAVPMLADAAPVLEEATAPLPEPAVTPPVEPELGDIDLVEQMLRDRAGVRGLALKLIATQTGWRDVAWLDREADAKPGAATAPVELRGKRFGFLAAATSHAGELASWAAWLARWAALEAQVSELHEWAFRDELTGVYSRRYFNQFFERVIQRAIHERFRVTLMVFDIDNFKTYNDRHGHAAGDEILRETARLMQSVVRPHDIVARIGGDEFAVIFWDADEPRKPNSQHPDSVRAAAERFQKAICAHRFPKLAEEALSTLTISGGLAGFPWDGRTPQDLLELADQRALQSKRQGKNAVTFGPGAEAVCKP